MIGYWDTAGECLSPDLVIDFTETGELFVGGNFLAMNRANPDGWVIEIVETLAVDDRVSVQVRVTHGQTVFWCAGFYTVVSGQIATGTEHWATEGSAQPPDWRRPFAS